jgi:hypothetical protein
LIEIAGVPRMLRNALLKRCGASLGGVVRC